MPSIDSPATTGSLVDRFLEVRAQTEALAAPLTPEDQQVQSMPDVSPTKWHRAHITWFFETFLLVPHQPGYERVDDFYNFLYNSYYEAVGARHPRPDRGLITRPTNDEVTEYRRRVDESMVGFIETVAAGRPDLLDLVVLGLHHEQQHQELILMDIKHVLSCNPFAPAYRPQERRPAGPVPDLGWVEHVGGIVEIGHDGAGFHFDNEGPRHQALLQPHRIADRLVTAGEWLDFMADDGYHRPELWLADGWHHICKVGWEAPQYWQVGDDGWEIHTLNGVHPVDHAEPVVHVSYYEADAYARWAGHRLPTEFEWEAHAAQTPVVGNFLPTGALHPLPADGVGDVQQLFGDVWEWTASSYAPYPGFRPVEGAVGEYNGKFMIDQQVLRGGSCVTPGGHTRATYRNFFPTRTRWMFSGVRLADDGGVR
ncbi:MAG: ergothioneine biosynthesis protein EgtB [Actinomycetota bacterium]